MSQSSFSHPPTPLPKKGGGGGGGGVMRFFPVDSLLFFRDQARLAELKGLCSAPLISPNQHHLLVGGRVSGGHALAKLLSN